MDPHDDVVTHSFTHYQLLSLVRARVYATLCGLDCFFTSLKEMPPELHPDRSPFVI
jgi:hypothetical protein